MTLKGILALLLPAVLRGDAHAEFTRAVAENVHANKRRRTASVQATMAAETRVEALDATIHRIEGRSGDRLVDHPRVGDAALTVAKATADFLSRRRS